jgi:hypothetical protein
MRKAFATFVIVSLLMQTVGFAQTRQRPETRPASPTLGWIGVATMVTGAALMVPWADGESRSYNGQDYCYRQRKNDFDLERGGCGVMDPVSVKGGAITLAAGGAMALLGFRRVRVTPQVAKGGASLSASFTW